MNLEKIRKLIIASVCSDRLLLETLVLKGGNALDLVHQIGTRTSVDVDFSISTDFTDLEDIKKRLFKGLNDKFLSAGYVVFDHDLTPKPEQSKDLTWGGYRVQFKIIECERFESLGGDIANIRKQSISVGDPTNTRSFKIEISKYEYVEGKMEVAVDDFSVYAYTPEMIAVEKLRAICQQMEGYKFVKHPSARARDFYDIYSIIDRRAMVLREHTKTIMKMFEAKSVPLNFLDRIEGTREFHGQDWVSVRDSIDQGEKQDFDFYFDFLVREVKKLESFWEK
jgi:hypothetical protein